MSRLFSMLLLVSLIALWPSESRAGEPPDTAVSDLVKKLSIKDEYVRLNATLALGKLGKPAVVPVAEALADMDPDVRYYAVWALGLIGPDAKSQANAVIKLLADKNEQVRRKAVFALGRIAPEADDAVPPLIKSLGDDNLDVRIAAASAVARFGRLAVPILITALKDNDARIRLHSAVALGEIGADAETALSGLKALLEDKEKGVPGAAATALAKLGKVSLPTLGEALKSESEETRRVAIEALGKYPGADSASILVLALKDRSAPLRRQAVNVLGTIGGEAKVVVPALAELLKDEDPQLRQQVLYTINRQYQGEEAVPALLLALKDKDTNIRYLAASYLGGVGPVAKKAIPDLTEVAKTDSNPMVRNYATLALGRIGVEALPQLLELLKFEDQGVKRSAVTALQQLKARAKVAVPQLIELLKSADVPTRRTTCVTLGTIGPDAKDALDALKDLAANDPNGAVKSAAKNALTLIDKK